MTAPQQPRPTPGPPRGSGVVPMLMFGLPVIELIMLVWGTVEFGLWVGLYVLVAVVVGITIARLSGHEALQELRTAMAERRQPKSMTLSNSSLAAIAGILIAIPGPVTDVAGLLMLVPGVRPWIGRRFRAWAQKQADASGATGVRMRTTQAHTVIPGAVVSDEDAGESSRANADGGERAEGPEPAEGSAQAGRPDDRTIIRGEVEP